MIITIDGPSGLGKHLLLAKLLKIAFCLFRYRSDVSLFYLAGSARMRLISHDLTAVEGSLESFEYRIVENNGEKAIFRMDP